MATGIPARVDTGRAPSVDELRGRLATLLDADHEAADVLERWDRWGSELVTALSSLYPQPDLPDRIVDLIAAGHLARRPSLRELDEERSTQPDWFQSSQAVGYAAYAQRFGGDLKGVMNRIDYLQNLGVTYLHLMPLLETRPGENDGGYAVMDYERVRPSLGTMEDLSELTFHLHRAGISLALDLVLNHVAYEHRWAQAARSGDPYYQDYFWTFPDRDMPDKYEQTLPEVFPHTAPGNFTWDPQMKRWVWTTFYTWQWDLNWSNPNVMHEFVKIVINLANHGVDCLRLDAIPFLWKRLGTNCQNQPEVHVITRILRTVARIVAPGVVFKAEAIVGPADLIEYFGTGEQAGRLSDMAYHNTLMVQIWSALATRDARLLDVAISRLPDLPSNTAWATYLRCHDDIGWAIDDTDAATVGLQGPEYRRFLTDFYTGAVEDSFGEGVVFQENPFTGDRRVSGTTASLAGIGRARNADELELAIDRMLIAYAIVLGFGGIPIVYMGDEWALLNDLSYLDEPEHAEDARWIHRPWMPWTTDDELPPPETPSMRVFEGLSRLIQLRKATNALHAGAPTRTAMTSVSSVICLLRKHPSGDLLQVYNVADKTVKVPAQDIDRHVPGAHHDLISGDDVFPVDGEYELPPYAMLWLAKGT